MTVYTIGHARRLLADFVALLQGAGVAILADLRTLPRSRFCPQFNGASLAAALQSAGIRYRHLKALGGLRGPRDLPGPSPNALWDSEAFRNYADYALGPDFRAGLTALLALVAEAPTAIMCAEADWRRCHRRIVADYLLAAGNDVVHIAADGSREPASLTRGAVTQPDGTVYYPGVQGELRLL